jgi:hypothetical protein
MGISVFPVASSAGVTKKVSTFTSTGTFTAPSNCSSVEITLVGGGGGGGGARYGGNNSMRIGGGGGGGLVVKKQLSVTPGTSYTVTIGAGGSGGTLSAAGSVGSDSSFGSLATALGGGSGASRNGQTSVTYHAVPRGTGGGAWGQQNGLSGAGGGAAGSALQYGYNTAVNYQPFLMSTGSVVVAANNNRGQGGGAGGQPFPTSSTNTAVGIAGIGIDGFGNGAAGTYGTTDGTLNFYVSSGYANQLPQAINQGSANGTAATANTGDGGNGGCSANINDEPQGDATGGAGGSGICIVTYWS